MQQVGWPLIFMQDGAPGHSARNIREYLEACGVEILRWPSHSPDLNPIENLWAIMKDWIADHYPDYVDDNEVNKQIIQEAWDAIDPQILRNLALSMPARMRAVIVAN